MLSTNTPRPKGDLRSYKPTQFNRKGIDEMDEYINNESAEMQDVAEPAEDVTESAETQEAAEPASADNSAVETDDTEQTQTDGRTAQDAAFAEMRRANQELERQNRQMMEALSRYFDGEDADDLFINAMAYADQRQPDEYRVEFEQSRELESLRAEKEALEEQLMNAEVERLMRDGLRDVQSIDPNIKSLDELGGSFLKFISAGLTTKEAYYASMAQQQKEKIFAPDAIGRVSDTKVERDYYTSEELDNLTDEEMDANWDKVMRSMTRLSKK